MEDEKGTQVSIYVSEQQFSRSVHGSFSCVDCHIDIDVESHPGERSRPVNCSQCHDDVEEQYLGSLHGLALRDGVKDAPVCTDCHGYHFILTEDDSASNMYPSNVVQMCARCHADHRTAKENSKLGPYSVEAYRNGTHFNALTEKKNLGAAACNDCHGGHSMKPATDPESQINRLHISETCGS